MARIQQTQRLKGPQLHLAFEQPPRFLDRDCSKRYRFSLSASVDVDRGDQRLNYSSSTEDQLDGSEAIRMIFVIGLFLFAILVAIASDSDGRGPTL